MRRTLALLAIVVGLIFAAGQSFGQMTQMGVGPVRGSAVVTPVAFDVCATAVATAIGTTVTSNDLTISGGLSNSGLVAILINSGGGNIVSPVMTWNGTSMTPVATGTSSGSSEVYLFGLRNPAAGNNALVASWTGTAQGKLDGCSFQHVNQTNDAAAFTNANNASGTTVGAASVTITSTVNDMVVAGHAVASGANITAVSGTSIFIDNSGGVSGVAANRDAGAASVAMTATIGSSSVWASAGINVAH